MQQRYMDAELGRFLTPDPVGPEEDFINHFNRYNYAQNNPVRYTDPDGRVVKTSQQVVDLINAESQTRYRLDDSGVLESTQQCNMIVGSSSYSNDIDSAIASPELIQIKVAQNYLDPQGVVKDVDVHNGGGLTAVGGKLVLVSGNNAVIDRDINGNPVLDGPSSVVRHEITGHVVPILQGKSGSARDYDNVSRVELGKPALAPTPPPPNDVPDLVEEEPM